LKPLNLKFSGLQSYREEQEISFGDLGLLGVFGVFGPTGAGKSTVLDAITLALFGKVERAKSGTRGIMNQFENKLAVSFEFSLGDERYIAERVYGREKHDPIAVRNKGARLVKISGETCVLADKAGEMDARVLDLLGMTFEDFSRAVILPQGKFDQFLKLTGSERARMLENIFGLERFGENLWKKASALENKLHNELRTNEKLIEQLGEASDEMIKKAEELLKLQVETVREKAVLRKKAETHLKETEQTAAIYKEISILKKEAETLEAEKPLMDRHKTRLEKAKKAIPLGNLLSQIEDLSKKEHEESVKYETHEITAQQIKARLNDARERLAAAKSGETELNRLKEKELPRAALAFDYEKQAAKQEAEIKLLEQAAGRKQKELKALKEEGQEKGKLLEKTQQEIEALSLKRRSVTGILSNRREIESAVAALADLENAEIQAKEARETMQMRETALAAEEHKLSTILALNINPPMGNVLTDSPAHLLPFVSILVQGAEADLHKAEENRDEITAKNMAGFLAEKLSEGKPCPVCGSSEHPHPAVDAENDEQGAAFAIDTALKAKEKLDRLRDWETKAGLAANTYQTVEKELSTIHRPNLEVKQQALTEARARVADKSGFLAKNPEDFPQPGLSVSEPDAIRLIREALRKADQDNIELTNKITALQKTEKNLVPEITELRERYARIKAEEAGFRANASRGNSSLTELANNIKEITGGISPGDFEQNLTKRINSLQKEITESQLAWESAGKEDREIEKTTGALKAGLDKIKEHLADLNASLGKSLSIAGFANLSELKESLLDEFSYEKIQKALETHNKSVDHTAKKLTELHSKIKDLPFTPEDLIEANKTLDSAKTEHEEAVREEGILQNRLDDLRKKQVQWLLLRDEDTRLKHRKELASRLVSLLKGRRFVQFLAEEHLRDMAAEASIRLGILTGHRYALELDEDCSFVMRDDYNGGLRRPVNTLSGGETFLTSLSLALALSSKIQLKGQFPLEFFFLDEGFGTLDPEKLEVVINTLERLHDGNRMVGVITHIPELRNRFPRYIEVIPSSSDGSGSRVTIKTN